MASADFSQFVVTMLRFEYVYSFTPVRPHGINQYSFLVYLLGLLNRVTVTFGTSLLFANLSAYCAFVPSFCSSGYDFAIPSSRLHLTVQTLGVAFGLVGNYLPADFHRRALICPSYKYKPPRVTAGRFFFIRQSGRDYYSHVIPAVVVRSTTTSRKSKPSMMIDRPHQKYIFI